MGARIGVGAAGVDGGGCAGARSIAIANRDHVAAHCFDRLEECRSFRSGHHLAQRRFHLSDKALENH